MERAGEAHPSQIDRYTPEVSDVSEDENSKGMENVQKNANSGGHMPLTSVVDVMNRARKRRCGGKIMGVAADKLEMNPPRSDAEMVDLAKKRLVGFS